MPTRPGLSLSSPDYIGQAELNASDPIVRHKIAARNGLGRKAKHKSKAVQYFLLATECDRVSSDGVKRESLELLAAALTTMAVVTFYGNAPDTGVVGGYI